MKKFLLTATLAVSVTFNSVAQLERGPVTTSSFARQILTNDTPQSWLALIFLGTNYYSFPLLGGTNVWSGTNTFRGVTVATNNSNTFIGGIYGGGAPATGFGTPYFKDGYFGFVEDTGGDYRSGMFLNTLHGGPGNGSEVQWSFNQMAFGTDIDGGHVQMGHLSHSNEWFYLERGTESGHSDDANYFGHSHFLGWQYSYATNGAEGFGYWWSSVTNVNSTTGKSRWELFAPTGNAAQLPALNQIGPSVLTVGQDGSITPGNRFVHRLVYPSAVGITNVFVNYTNGQYAEIDISSPLNLIDTNLGSILTTLPAGVTVAVQKDLIIVPGFVNWPLATPTAWQWESEGGTVVAPTNIPANTKMHIRITATLGTATNVYARYTLIPYGVVMDADATNFLNAAGITNNTTRSAITTFVISAKAHGYWTKSLAGYPFVGATSNSCSWNIVNTNTFRIAWHGTVTFDATGITGDASTAYGDTALIPSTACSSMLDTFAGGWIRGPAVPVDTGLFYGVTGNTTSERWGMYRNGTALTTSGMNANAFAAQGYAGGGNFTGFLGQRRIGTTSEQDYFNSVAVGPTSGFPTATSLPIAQSVYVLARNQQGTADHFSDVNLSSFWVGEAFTAQNVSDLISDLTALNSALGR